MFTGERLEIECKNCMEYIKGECAGAKVICEFFKKAPDISLKSKAWPKYGDATYIRLYGPRRY